MFKLNLLSSAMRKLFLITLIISTCFLFNAHVSAQTIPVSITEPNSLGACTDNLFKAAFNLTQERRITIALTLNFNGPTVNSCQSAGNPPQVLFVLDSSTVQVTNIDVDTAFGTWTATIDSGFCELFYHVYIDCSVIPEGSGSSTTLNFFQTWTDSLLAVYNLDSSGASSVPISVLKPYLYQIPVTGFTANYLDTVRMNFMYKNTNSDTANILFRFYPDSSDYCGALPMLALNYKIGKNGTPFPYVPGDAATTVLPSGDTLIFEQLSFDTLCIYCDTVCTNDSCTRSAILKWHCNIPPATDSLFCTDCLSEYVNTYNVVNASVHNVRVDRLDPDPQTAFYDHSCLNDTTVLFWRYSITNNGMAALDSLKISLNYFDTESFGHLTLIPGSSLSVSSNCSGCQITTDTTHRDIVLCTRLVPDALFNASTVVTAFSPKDTVWISFTTVRCGEEDDQALLNVPKYFNHWKLKVLGKTICGESVNVSPDTVNNVSYSNPYNSLHDLDLKLQFLPTVTDLSVPKDSVFGDTSLFNITCREIVNSKYDYQLFGSNSSEEFKLSGWLKAVVHCEQGLVIRDRENQVYFEYFNASGNKVIINADFYHTLIPKDTCMAGDYVFYFDLNDTLMFDAITGGDFIFTLQACCSGSSGTVDFDVKFYVIPDPDSCITLTYTDTLHIQPPNCTGIACNSWIPLSSAESRIFKHCPGCLAPGVIVKDYKMHRTSFGIQDSDNDGIADTSLPQIAEGTSWYNTNKNNLKLLYSSYGDTIEDRLSAFFQEGDPGSDGYSYLQMKNVGLTLPFLQLSRLIPAGFDTMKLVPVSFTFFIDTLTDSTNANCIDCSGFALDPARTRTMYHITKSGNAMYTFLDTVQNANRLLFTFDGSVDSAFQLIGNLDNPDFLIH